jgi:hypothetical protein
MRRFIYVSDNGHKNDNKVNIILLLNNQLTMHHLINQKVYEITDVPEDIPFVSIIIPFEPKMKIKFAFDNIINAAAAKTEKELMESFPENNSAQVIRKMHHALHNLNFKKHNGKSIGIFVSPLLEKVYYFNYHTPPADSNDRTAI